MIALSPKARWLRRGVSPRLCVYALHGSDGEIIYVGKTHRLRQRIRAHMRKGFQRVTFVRFSDELKAEMYERAAIARIGPRYNKQVVIRLGWLAVGESILVKLTESLTFGEIERRIAATESWRGGRFYRFSIEKLVKNYIAIRRQVVQN